MELYNWIDATRDSHLTIKDVKEMREGERMVLVCLDRNVCDNAHEGANAPHEIKDAKDFLSEGYHIEFVKGTEGISGTITLWCGINNRGDWTMELENFDINYEGNRFYPLDGNGYLPCEDPYAMATFHYDFPEHWSEFPDTTRIGWRGPAVPLEKMDFLPQMVFHPSEIDDEIYDTNKMAA